MAEQLTLAEKAEGNEKILAQDRCFMVVLKLWNHRSDWPSGLKPFEKFVPIFETLQRLNPDEPKHYFHPSFRSKVESVDNEKAEVIHLMGIVDSIDVAARVLIQTALESAAEMATSETTKCLLKEALPVKSDGDIRVVRKLLHQDDKNSKRDPKERTALLKKRVEQLDGFSDLCEKVRNAYATELETTRNRAKKVNKRTK